MVATRPDLARAIARATTQPVLTGPGQPVFTATVLGAGAPCRIQADDGGAQYEATATTGYTPAVNDHVLALRTGARVYVMRIP